MMVPLRISFSVGSGYVPPAMPAHLDSLLAYVATAHREESLPRKNTLTLEALRALGEQLPLERHTQDGDWCWKASALIPRDLVQHRTRVYTRKSDVNEFALAVGRGWVQYGERDTVARKRDESDPRFESPVFARQSMIVSSARGRHRNMLGSYSVVDPVTETGETKPHLTFDAWCIGDARAIEDMLDDVMHLGARRRQGYGRVKEVTVCEDPRAEDLWRQRVRPWPLLADDVPVMAACRAPYWAPENRRLAYCPAGLR